MGHLARVYLSKRQAAALFGVRSYCGSIPLTPKAGLMSGFDNPRQTWNARYARDDYHFGEEPNAFLREHVRLLNPGQSVLCVADG